MLVRVDARDERTQTSAFGVSRREGHDSAAFYSRFAPPTLSDDDHINRPEELIDHLGQGRLFHHSATDMVDIPDNSVALVVTSPPYFVGKEYELAIAGDSNRASRVPETYIDFLEMLHDVFAECTRVLEPGGRIAVNVANLGRKPYRSLSADIITILQNELGLLLRGEVIWEKATTSSGSCAWGSFARASNPVLRDMTERVIIASKGRFNRALTVKARQSKNLPHVSTLTNDEFLDVTKDVWRIDSESATRIGHPAPFPVDLPRRLIELYTYKDDIVLDPFAGSGTTLVAAARTGRIGVGFDIDSDYIDLAQQRLDAELERTNTLAEVTSDLDERPLEEQEDVISSLSTDERQEAFYTSAVDEGKKVQDIALRRLEAAGFADISTKAKHSSGIVQFNFQLTNADGSNRWWVDVPGAFTSSRPGMQRAETVWKLLGRLHVLAATEPTAKQDHKGVLVLTPSIPKAGTPGDKALRAVGPGVIFDVVELYDPVGLERLRRYATDEDSVPLAGFWKPSELSS